MRKYPQGRTFWLIALSAFVTLQCVAMGILLYTWQADMRKDLASTHRESVRSVRSISEYLDNVFMDIAVTASAANDTEWVQKLCADSAVFETVFDHVRQREIAGDYLFHVGNADVISRRFMIFPYADVCIGKNVWSAPSAYFGLLGVAQSERAALTERIRQAQTPETIHLNESGTAILVVYPIENLNNPRAYLCCSINLSVLSERVQQMMAPGVVGVRLIHGEDGGVLIEEGVVQEDGGIEKYSHQTKYIDWAYELFVDPAIASVEYTARELFVVRYALTLTLLCALLGYGLAIVLYRPIVELMKRAGIRRQEKMWGVSDYEVLGRHLEYMNEQYRQGRRTTFLHQLLTGFFVQDEELLQSVGLPFNRSGFYRVFICVEKDAPSGEKWREEMRMKIERFLKERGLVCESLDTVNSEIILIMACKTEEAAENLPKQALRDLLSDGYEVYWGSVSPGLMGISLSYQAAIEKRRRRTGVRFSQFYLPVEWERQWTDALLNGKLAIAERICLELQRENDRRMAAEKMSRGDYERLFGVLIGDLSRVVEESNLRAADMLADLADMFEQGETEQIWGGIQSVCSALCEQETEEKLSGDVSEQIVRYIREHYASSGLSLTSLSDSFALSANTINKCLRQASGMTFHAFLTQCRIERAKELLSLRQHRIAEVAEMVGYDTEYSFRRAFHRYTGVKAQTYEVDEETIDGQQSES